MVSSFTELATSEALLESAAAKAEAAWAILADRRCRPVDALPVLELGFLRLAAGLGRAGEGERPLARLMEGELPGVESAARARLAAALEALQAQGSGLRARDPQLSKAELELLAACLATCARAALRALRPGGAAAALRRRAPLAAAVAAFLVGVAALAVPRHTPRTGWRGTYFRNTRFSGPSQIRRDPTLSFFWDTGAPFTGFPADDFTARWDGCLRVDTAGEAHFSLGSDDLSRLYVDGHRVVDNWVPHSLTFRDGKVWLPRGVHWVRVDYEEQTGDAAVMLKLGWNGQVPLPIDPWTVLYPESPEPDPCAALR